MEFLKLRSFRKALKRKGGSVPQPGSVESEGTEQKKIENCDATQKAANDQPGADDVDDGDDDDDFITNEVKRRLKELRKNSFMVVIPEESCPEEEEDGDASSSEWRDSELEEKYPWFGFDAFYEKYCERMLFFDKMSSQQLHEAGSQNPSPKSSSKLVLMFRDLSFKKKDGFQDDTGHLQQELQGNTPRENIEIAYVAQICLTWEALHCQFMELYQRIASQQSSITCYSYAAQAFQQFQVLLQRFIENEHYEDGTRCEIYLKTRNYLPKLLQVPNFHGLDEKQKADGSESVLASDLANVLGDCILTFHNFLKADNKKLNGTLHLFGDHNQRVSSLQQIQNSFDKKEIKIKELFKKKKSWKKKCWPATEEEILLLFGLIDVKVVSRVLRMAKITKEQLVWCEEKMCKLHLSENGLQRDASPVLFPC